MKDVEPLQPKVFHKGEKHSRKLYLEIFNSVLLPWPFPVLFFFFFTAVRPSYSEWLGGICYMSCSIAFCCHCPKYSVKLSHFDANNRNKLSLGSTYHFYVSSAPNFFVSFWCQS